MVKIIKQCKWVQADLNYASDNKVISYMVFMACDFSECDINEFAFYRCSFSDCIFSVYPLIHDACLFMASNVLTKDQEQDEHRINTLRHRLENRYTPEESADILDIIAKDGGKHFGPPSHDKIIAHNPDYKEVQVERGERGQIASVNQMMNKHLLNTGFKMMDFEEFDKLDDTNSVVLQEAEFDWEGKVNEVLKDD